MKKITKTISYLKRINWKNARLIFARAIRNLPALVEAVRSDVNYRNRKRGELSLIESYLLFAIDTKMSEPFYYVPF